MTSPHEVATPVTASLLRVDCAWCHCTIREGDKDAPVSHGLCQRCADNLLRQDSPGRIA